MMNTYIPFLKTDNETINQAFRIAVGDFIGNISLFKASEFSKPKTVIIAGMDYVTPWTRDAAFNTWYAGALLSPQTAENTMKAVLIRDENDNLRIGGEYWDAIIWTTGAWEFYLRTGKRDFLALAFMVTLNSLNYFEETEQDPEDGLFRGGACFQDGIAAYPDKFVSKTFGSGIMNWLSDKPTERVETGVGLPMKALSTNCLYYNAYIIAYNMQKELGCKVNDSLKAKAAALKQAINQHFWNADKGYYRYLVEAGDNQERQEGFGHAFAIMFGIADEEQTKAIIQNQHITQNGIPCVWPQYERYATEPGAYARHSGTIWPQVNTAWVYALLKQKAYKPSWDELKMLAEKACRDKQFVEIYHPETGEQYGGLQEHPEAQAIIEWESCNRQTWCAAGYIFMVISLLCGIRFETNGIRFQPYLPEEINELTLTNLHYCNSILTISIQRSNENAMTLNDHECLYFIEHHQLKTKNNIVIQIR